MPFRRGQAGALQFLCQDERTQVETFGCECPPSVAKSRSAMALLDDEEAEEAATAAKVSPMFKRLGSAVSATSTATGGTSSFDDGSSTEGLSSHLRRILSPKASQQSPPVEGNGGLLSARVRQGEGHTEAEHESNGFLQQRASKRSLLLGRLAGTAKPHGAFLA
mmetsp:Transcript_82960/g.238425  ORF Transcript_82960/g.238425 Transcript_82960/m.238425 type:complete len:164 (-) Transcript_82960:330-821(-)|eukprot:CAMPEP_0177164490 /NCGR_PEP_ID=MMETSP0367-20130122/6976_1 /TAXON_ID=447022 ORGANISM="Scrippsiella hangoei-like, Strain SHHI-4" /NCGR_SAMPLE_ID=MMETSP0367 /ASSEMBLY_ACC=CAM_ASM_000362 /LENGTH=163 /DNA_ID=CAMNT_0018610391 /DNA_START=65 /DNA_END=556 /DNA_ORIENTATION=+